jgi:lipopolysaccharide transport system permease protein
LPNETIVIESTRGWLDLGFKDLWLYRELLYFLVWRDVKVRYKQTALGAVWAVLQPLLTMVVFTIVFSRIAGIESEGAAYPIFSFVALLPWNFFAQGLTQSSNSLVGSSHLITKVYFPRFLIPFASVLSGGVDLAIALIVLGGMMAFYGVRPAAALLLLPVFVLLALITALAAGTWLSALNVKYRDVRYLVPFTVQIWLFVSPVIYPASMMMERLEASGLPGWLYGLNPMAGVIEGFRWAVLGTGSAPVSLIIASGVVSCLALAAGVIFFRRMERGFADIV